MVIGCGLWVIGYWLLVRMQIDRTVYLTIIPTAKNQQPKTKNQKPKTKNQQPQ